MIFYDQHCPKVSEICQRWALVFDENAFFELKFQHDTLCLYKRDEPKLSAISVDFTSGAVAHRRKFGGGKGQSIAKAVGLKNGKTPTVIDATAGLGRDAFVLASLGCSVTLIERNPIVAALLEDGLRRGYLDAEIGEWMRQRMILNYGSSQTTLHQLSLNADVVYLDPMYPHREKSALIKKEMRLFQSLVGSDQDADELLQPALDLATKRVVVKRPDYAEPLNQQPPSTVISTKKNRFDIYVKAAM
ncbi:class I SAM-dependent methyltransferase [Parashewanella spongiae]|uniref:class I SAM-dependent methyltransferase n=1 Tax=Parashewanella spongiae TaxID=342950 RepID=UPI0035D788D6